ncbi:MAG TPA: hypothetical protein VH916_08780 [Dehalococcoidia bacterium]|jgi:hypothetical protein
MTDHLLRRRPGRRWLITLALLALLFACLSAGGRHAAAQSDPDCEDPATVACIPTTPAGGSGGAAPASPAGPGAAAAAPAAPLPPAPYPICPPPGPPIPVPVAPVPSAAPSAGPVGGYNPCYGDVYGSINRANLAYARAMRSLDASQLRLYWGQDALQDLLGQIGQLRASNSYRVLRLLSIRVIEQSVGPSYAWVHTSEHWVSQTWSYDGYEYDSGDAWYDNQYYLYRSGGRWIIGSDVVS